jgi:CheY-like chemotaxis protein
MEYNRHCLRHKKRFMNILIVDDDLSSANSIKELLELNGHEVTIIDEPTRCITLCQNNKYDLVFMDYHMDGLNGSQITEILKENNFGNTIIFAHTGDNSSEAIKSFKDAGMDGLIIKPIDLLSFELLISFFEDNNILNNNQSTKMIITKRSNQNILFF